MHEGLVNRLGGLSLPRKSVVRLTDHPDMTVGVCRGRETTMQHRDGKNPSYSQINMVLGLLMYSRTSMARTLMARKSLPRLFQTRSCVPRKKIP